MKDPWIILIFILINFGCSEKIVVEDNETIHTYAIGTNVASNGTFFDESYETSENLTTSNYEITHFNDTHAEVRNLFER